MIRIAGLPTVIRDPISGKEWRYTEPKIETQEMGERALRYYQAQFPNRTLTLEVT